MMKVLPAPLHELPPCFQIATIVPTSMKIAKADLHFIQNTLITIWKKHVEEWYGIAEDQPQAIIIKPPDMEHSSSHTIDDSASNSTHPAPKRSHILKIIPSGGVFCCRCGLQTKIMQHQRLKILSKACAYPDLPESEWLSAPGVHAANHRILAAEKQLHEKHNKGDHLFIWNRQIGKDKNKSNFG